MQGKKKGKKEEKKHLDTAAYRRKLNETHSEIATEVYILAFSNYLCELRC
jgi:hypothetical protein